MESALILGVSQHAIENEYYFVDLPKLLQTKARFDAIKRMEELQLAIATNNRLLDDEGYRKLTHDLSKRAGVKQEETFNRGKFEQLRSIANGGGNRA